MYKIVVNSVDLQIGMPIPDKITSCSVFFGGNVKIMIDNESAKRVETWLLELVDKIKKSECEYIMVNNVVTPVKHITEVDI